MADGPASFWTQANALLRKNLTFQKRDVKPNIRLILVPVVLCLLLVLIQNLVNKELDKPSNRCGCKCVDKNGDGKCEEVCGIEYSDLDQVGSCPIPSPPEWPPLLQIPASMYRAVQTDSISYRDLPDDSCKTSGSCPATILLTGTNQTFGESVGRNFFSSGSTLNSSDIFYSLAYNILGSESQTELMNFLEAAFFSNLPVYNVQPQCPPNSTFSFPLEFGSVAVQQEISCVKGLHLWRNSSYEINDELYKGYRKGNPEGKINEIIAGSSGALCINVLIKRKYGPVVLEVLGGVTNRIGGAKFELNGVEYKLPANDHGNTLHGGSKGFSDVIWTVKDYQEDSHLTLTYKSFDGEQGFSGDLSVKVKYMFIGTNKLAINMQATPLNKATPINLASHTYWNLGGHTSGNIFSYTIQLFGSKITPVDDKLIPTGQITPVEGTAYDFLKPRTIGSKFSDIPGGYDINDVLDNTEGKHLQRVAIVQESIPGRKMELWTNKPGVQFCTSNMLENAKGKGGFVYSKYAALCCETQGFPDSVNHPNFPSQIVNPGETYKHIMVYRFTA